MATKKAPAKTTTEKKAAPTKKKSAQPKTVVQTPATEKALKKMAKRMTKFVIANDEEQVDLYFAGIIQFIETFKEERKKP